MSRLGDEGGLPSQTQTESDANECGDARSSLAAKSPGEHAQRFRIDGEVGRGGVGIVLQAHDVRLGRTVALKTLQRDDDLARRRFEREMRITARLQHPGIVPVHEAGVSPQGTPFYSMKLVEGQSLKALLDKCTGLEERLTYLPQLVAVAETIAFAHSRGIIHRDLKPSNVIIGSFGEAVVIDWGLAKDLSQGAHDEDHDLAAGPYRSAGLDLPSEAMTVVGQVLGTPAYMPPEQASGGTVDQLADVYALGAMLRQVLTGRPPYSGASKDVLKAVVDAPPTPIREQSPRAPLELVAIAERAMAREATRRYRNVAAFLDDMRRYLRGQPVSVYDYDLRERLWKFALRHRGASVTGVVAIVALLAGTTVALYRITQEQHQSEHHRIEAVTERNRLLVEKAALEVERHEPAAALETLSRYPDEAAEWEKVSQIVRDAAGLGLPRLSVQIPFPSPRAVIGASQRSFAVASATRLLIWEVQEGTVLSDTRFEGGASDRVSTFDSFESSGRDHWVVGTTAGLLHIVYADVGGHYTVETSRPCGSGSIEDTLAENGRAYVTVGCATGVVSRVGLGATVELIENQGRPVRGLARLSSGDLVLASMDGSLQTWGPRKQAYGPIGPLLSNLTTSSQCQYVAHAGMDGSLTLRWLEQMRNEAYRVSALQTAKVEISEDCRYVAANSIDSQFVVIDVESAGVIMRGKARNFALLGDRHSVITGDDDGRLDIVDLHDGHRQTLYVERGSIWAIRRIGNELLVCGRRASLLALPPIRAFALPSEPATMATASDRSRVLVGTLDGDTVEYDAFAGRIVASNRLHRGRVIVRSARNDGFYTLGLDDGCVYFTAGTSEIRPLFCDTSSALIDLASTEAGVVTAATNGRIIFIDEQDSRPLTMLEIHTGARRVTYDERTGAALVGTSDGRVFAVKRDGVSWSRTVGLGVVVAYPVEAGAITTDALSGEMKLIGNSNGSLRELGRCGAGFYRGETDDEGREFVVGCGDGTVLRWIDELGVAERVPLMETSRPRNDMDLAGDSALSCGADGLCLVLDRSENTMQVAGGLGEIVASEYLDNVGQVVTVARDKPSLRIWTLTKNSRHIPLAQSALSDFLRHRTKEHSSDPH